MEIQELLRCLTSLLFVTSICSSFWIVADGSSIEDRVLTYRETLGNHTFECSASGACVPCSYSEKSDEKFHCSETGYRMPYKCVEVKNTLKGSNKEQIQEGFSVKEEAQSGTTGGHKDAPSEEQQTQKRRDQNTKGNNGNWRRLLEGTYVLEDEKQTYHIFKSCIPVAEEEKLSVLGFEAIVLFLLLICSPVVYYRKKRSFMISGATRIPTNARF